MTCAADGELAAPGVGPTGPAWAGAGPGRSAVMMSRATRAGFAGRSGQPGAVVISRRTVIAAPATASTAA